MLDQRFLSKVLLGLTRDKERPVGERIGKGARLVSETLGARWAFRDCQVGPGARVHGRVRVDNRGTITLGRDLVVHGEFLPVEFLCGEGAQLEIGDGVWINFGCVIAAKQRVRVGNRVMIGQHTIVSDVDVPEHAVQGSGEPKPIEIGDDAWLAGRVTIAPGVRIGEGAVVTAGSVVTTDIPPHVVAGGSPARVLRVLNGQSPAQYAETSFDAKPTALPVEPPRPVATPVEFTGTLIADTTVDGLVDALRLPSEQPALGAEVVPFGQVTQYLLQPPAASAADFCVVWTLPQLAVPLFASVLAHEEVDEQQLLEQVDLFTNLVQRAAVHYKAVFIPTWVVPPWSRGLGMQDCRTGGVARALSRMNLRLMDNMAQVSSIFVFDQQRWFASAQRSPSEPKGWYLGKIAVPQAVITEAAHDIRAAMSGVQGRARKLLVLDLDDTLWGGIVGDAGWENLHLGGLDPQGESFVDFQKAIKRLKRRGVVLGIVSKNEESTALEAIRSHPEMILKEDDFVGWKINWQDKAKNIADLTSELNLGLQSVVFIDDNPVERARVREALPEVYVPEWPADKLEYCRAFGALRCFDLPSLSKEDLERTLMYAEERKRTALQEQVGSIDEWLMSLDIKVRVESLNSTNLARAAQLLNKTNQMNLTTRRLTEAELTEWANTDGHVFYTVSVSDRFGDSGLTGLLSVERTPDEAARIVDYVLSCRVMGRKVEETMLHLAVTWAQSKGARRVVAELLETKKNKPCLGFFQRSGFETNGNVFEWDAQKSYDLPTPITVDRVGT